MILNTISRKFKWLFKSKIKIQTLMNKIWKNECRTSQRGRMNEWFRFEHAIKISQTNSVHIWQHPNTNTQNAYFQQTRSNFIHNSGSRLTHRPRNKEFWWHQNKLSDRRFSFFTFWKNKRFNFEFWNFETNVSHFEKKKRFNFWQNLTVRKMVKKRLKNG